MTRMAAKWLKSIPNLWPKRQKNHTLWGRTYLYSPYKGVPPGHVTRPTSMVNRFELGGMKNMFVYRNLCTTGWCYITDEVREASNWVIHEGDWLELGLYTSLQSFSLLYLNFGALVQFEFLKMWKNSGFAGKPITMTRPPFKGVT